jgi:DNA-binding transcriptional LysR family regulator
MPSASRPDGRLEHGESDRGARSPLQPAMITLHQLRIFWAVAHSESLTRVAKQLGVTQPSLSQQLAKLESAVGGRLFDRVNNQLVLTDAGRYLLRKAEIVLAEMDEAEAGLAEFKMGRRARISLGALSSLARTVVPGAFARALKEFPDLELDMHELAPAEALEQLYGRNLQVALLSSVSLAANRISFSRVDVARDPYVLATPRGLDLGCVTDPEWELTSEQRRLLNRTIAFNFGNLHNQRVEEWYRRVLPRHQVVAQCRTYESALAMVEAGLGVALVPWLCTQLGGRAMHDIDLYAVPDLERPIVALVPSQYRHAQPFATFLRCLQEAATALVLPPVLPAPPFLRAAHVPAAEPSPRA